MICRDRHVVEPARMTIASLIVIYNPPPPPLLTPVAWSRPVLCPEPAPCGNVTGSAALCTEHNRCVLQGWMSPWCTATATATPQRRRASPSPVTQPPRPSAACGPAAAAVAAVGPRGPPRLPGRTRCRSPCTAAAGWQRQRCSLELAGATRWGSRLWAAAEAGIPRILGMRPDCRTASTPAATGVFFDRADVVVDALSTRS